MELVYSPLSLKRLRKIGPADLKKAKHKIDAILSDPLLGKHLKGDHAGQLSVKAWPLRIIYTFDSRKQTIEIITVGYRGDVYK